MYTSGSIEDCTRKFYKSHDGEGRSKKKMSKGKAAKQAYAACATAFRDEGKAVENALPTFKDYLAELENGS